MALQGLHSQFWAVGGAPPPPPPAVPGYASWQTGTGVTLGCGPVLGLSPQFWKRVRQRLAPYRFWIPERLWVLARVAWVLWSPAYARAQQAVRAVAVTPGMRDKHMWGEIGHRAGHVPGLGENVFRALLAVEQYGSTPPNAGHIRGTLLELAYIALKERGR